MFVHVYGEERSRKRKLHSREKEGENPNQRLERTRKLSVRSLSKIGKGKDPAYIKGAKLRNHRESDSEQRSSRQGERKTW